MLNWAYRLSNLAIVLALSVVLLGAWTRINDAGLSCPDWPGCYGYMVMPQDVTALEGAQQAYPDAPLDIKKVWLEMGHRYLAGALGLVVMFMAMVAFKMRRLSSYPCLSSYGLLVLVIVQAVFGMWTVTLKLLPLVVTLHLLGGVLTLAGLFFVRLHLRSVLIKEQFVAKSVNKWVLGAVVVLLLQIVLGGWTSTNYAGYGCSDWFVCNKVVDITPDYKEGFNLLASVGPNYQGGVLPVEARAAIQIVHRVGALVVFVYCLGLVLHLRERSNLRMPSVFVLVTLQCQLLLGVLTVVFSIPTGLAMLHHLCAVLLLIGLLWLYSRVVVCTKGDRYE